ncbi:hypothetical protein [Neptuniibacter sp.]|uniref:hypothetical protein n=1 Tax=Neptuniibacter sp. TaxID=1962643 RepID=UPI002613C77C|nr:hypothetical protein [Neptuniibacter sp.]MCP4595438.1 hypothetical protein [Neptuniibacter sp.]
MNKNEFINQYAHAWRIFERLVKDFDEDAWLKAGRGKIRPARLSLHILMGTKYYLDDFDTPMHYPSGKPFNYDWQKVKIADLPTQNDIVTCIQEVQLKTEEWLTNLDYSAENKPFPWTGETNLSVVLFLLRHSLFHIGELSSLLSESKDGGVKDYWKKTLRG